jgi:hypothetical protein
VAELEEETPPYVAMTLRLPRELAEWLRREAFSRRVTKTAVILGAIERERMMRCG